MASQIDFKAFSIGSGANVMTQAAYEALAALGVGYSSGTAPSNAFNKTFRQSSVMAAALATYISNTLDADVLDNGDLAALVGQLDAAIRAVVRQASGSAIVPLTFGSTINWDLANGSIFSVTMANNATLAVPANLAAGAYAIYVAQDSTGSHTLDFAANFRSSLGIPPILSTAPNAVDLLSFVSDGTHLDVSIQRSLS